MEGGSSPKGMLGEEVVVCVHRWEIIVVELHSQIMSFYSCGRRVIYLLKTLSSPQAIHSSFTHDHADTDRRTERERERERDRHTRPLPD
jgi:hypothetical protein